MYNKEHQEAKKAFRDYGLEPPQVTIQLTDDMLSYTWGEDEIFLGKGVRTLNLLGLWSLLPTIIHEMVHVFLETQIIPKYVKSLFGNYKQFRAGQNMYKMIATPEDGHVSRYGSTHPMENLVCCITKELMGEEWDTTPNLGTKRKAIQRWLQ